MIGIIGAMDIEIDGIVKLMTDISTQSISGATYTKGKIYNKECVVVMCGIGKVNAAVSAQTMILTYKPDLIINCGIGGGTSESTDVGDVVIATSVVQHDMDTTSMGDPLGLIDLPQGTTVYMDCDKNLVDKLKSVCDNIENIKYELGTVATGDQFISGKEKRMWLNKTFNAVACEMEGGSIAQVCMRNQVPFAILRSISDSIYKEEFMDYQTFRVIAANKSIEIISNFLK